MAWNKNGYISALFLAFVLAACGGDSGNNATDSLKSSTSVEGTNLNFNTLDGLNAESPCDASLNGLYAHINNINEDYVCQFNSEQKKWEWARPLETEESSSSREVSSSSYQKSSSSSDRTAYSSENTLSSSEVFIESSSSKANWEYLNPNISYGELIDDRDGQVYKTVQIGDQLWMAENLNYRYIVKTTLEDSSSFCGSDKCSIYGRQYYWSAAMDSAARFSKNGKGCGYGRSCNYVKPVRGICPENWHLPDSTEWSILTKNVSSLWAKKYTPNLDQADISGFSRLDFEKDCLEGYTFKLDKCRSERDATYFWSSTDDGPRAGFLPSWYGYRDSYYAGGYKNSAYSIRCIKDVSSSSTKASSSSKANWVYLNPDISYGEFVDERDGQVYKTVDIEEMTWMAENLNYNDGNLSDDSFCPNYDEEQCALYGRLYSWRAAKYNSPQLITYPMKGICPNGWHIPEASEFQKLVKYKCSGYQCINIRNQDMWIARGIIDWGDGYNYTFNQNATNETGFSIIPAGTGIKNKGELKYYSGRASFWSSSFDSTNTPNYFYLQKGDYLPSLAKATGSVDWEDFISIRCVKNEL